MHPPVCSYKSFILSLEMLHEPNLCMSGRSMPSRRLSILLQPVETTIRYLTLTGLTDSNCTA